MIECSRKIHFCYGHRVMNHESKCRNLHGHNGVLWIYATPIESLDSIGRVVDFGVLKNKVGTWVDSNWDHTMILCHEDTKTLELLHQVEANKKIFILNANPTAENMCEYLLNDVCPQVLKGLGIIVFKVVLYETENCLASASLNHTDPLIRTKYGY